jgi:DNA-binding PadR family transcriptional regulator
MRTHVLEVQNLSKHCNEALILASLSSGKKHGYQLALELEEDSKSMFKFNHGTLYPILHKLEKERLIKGTWKQEGPKRKRKYYVITTNGKKYLDIQRQQWERFFQTFTKIIGKI